MKEWYSCSTEKESCLVCGKKTGDYKKYEQSGMYITIPLCANEGSQDNCYSKVDVKKMAARFLTDVKQVIKAEMREKE